MAVAIAIGLLAFLGVFLVAVYLSLTGTLPFTFADGPAGVPPWLPIAVLIGVSATACVVPTILRRFRDRELTFREQIAINDRNSVLLCFALTAGAAATSYAIFTVLSLRTSVGLVAAAVATALRGQPPLSEHEARKLCAN